MGLAFSFRFVGCGEVANRILRDLRGGPCRWGGLCGSQPQTSMGKAQCAHRRPVDGHVALAPLPILRGCPIQQDLQDFSGLTGWNKRETTGLAFSFRFEDVVSLRTASFAICEVAPVVGAGYVVLNPRPVDGHVALAPLPILRGCPIQQDLQDFSGLTGWNKRETTGLAFSFRFVGCGELANRIIRDLRGGPCRWGGLCGSQPQAG